MQYLLVRTWFTAVRARAFLKLRTRCVEWAALSQTSHKVPFSVQLDSVKGMPVMEWVAADVGVSA